MTISSFKYTELNPRDPVGDYFVKLSVLDEIEKDYYTKQDKDLYQEVLSRRSALIAEAELKGIFKGRSN